MLYPQGLELGLERQILAERDGCTLSVFSRTRPRWSITLMELKKGDFCPGGGKSWRTAPVTSVTLAGSTPAMVSAAQGSRS